MMLSSSVLELCKQPNIAQAAFLHLSATSDPCSIVRSLVVCKGAKAQMTPCFGGFTYKTEALLGWYSTLCLSLMPRT